MVVAKVILYNKVFSGMPKTSDFKLVEEKLPSIKNNEFLVEAVYLSIDPFQRGLASALPAGIPFPGGQVGKIIESKNPKYPVGKCVVAYLGMRTHSISNGTDPFTQQPLLLMPELGKLPVSLSLGVLGMPGNTAYFGLLEICQPKAGETVVVSTAAGAVGSVVGQIAKIKGCKVIGMTSSDVKGQWLVDELKFDSYINYKTHNLDQSLKQKAPKGVDCYFDNVGGEMASTVLSHMNEYGRVSCCGAISAYNQLADFPKATLVQFNIIRKQLKMEGFQVTRWTDRWMEGINALTTWVQEDKIKYKETVTNGIENMPKAFIEMLNSENIGKVLVKV